MREITAQQITETVQRLSIEANYYLPEDMESALTAAQGKEESPLGKEVLSQIVENIKIARDEEMPICQDTGTTIVFLELGQEVHISGKLQEAVNEGVRRGYKEGYLRKSIVENPLERKNTGDNTPAVIWTEIVPGDRLRIIVSPKGGGCENMSALRMLKPADGVAGVKKFVREVILQSGPNPCPPVVVGIGIGGTSEKAMLLSKKALLRPIGERSNIPNIAKLEEELLTDVNRTGVGPMGLGGQVTALAVNIEIYPTHIASLPVAVNLACHANRHKEAGL